MDLKESTSEGSLGSLQPTSLQIFANTSTLHGIRHIFVYGPMTVRRALWALAFTASLGILLVESSERVIYYFSYQHVTKVDEVVANNLVFPAVTICNLNGFRFSHLTTNDLYHAGDLLALLDVNLQILHPHLADPAVLATLREKTNFQHHRAKVFSMSEFLGRVGHDMKEMLLYCKYRGQECSHKNFSTVSMMSSVSFLIVSVMMVRTRGSYSRSDNKILVWETAGFGWYRELKYVLFAVLVADMFLE
ncbi:hypothetical protein JRQ81_005176 [Phrynocephalus forsythii]|uniref:Acid-sensing ion channel 2-like n=1 Tax=Phrynocephalus forsythii TaxID=171643 RepID=A0A9Q0XGU5_9SAUR|nr:hypothetical protein JRQ81_005176 [Phrynocephalus forsythii]